MATLSFYNPLNFYATEQRIHIGLSTFSSDRILHVGNHLFAPSACKNHRTMSRGSSTTTLSKATANSAVSILFNDSLLPISSRYCLVKAHLFRSVVVSTPIGCFVNSVVSLRILLTEDNISSGLKIWPVNFLKINNNKTAYN